MQGAAAPLDTGRRAFAEGGGVGAEAGFEPASEEREGVGGPFAGRVESVLFFRVCSSFLFSAKWGEGDQGAPLGRLCWTGMGYGYTGYSITNDYSVIAHILVFE